MKGKKRLTLVGIAIVLCAAVSIAWGAEEHFGVTVYENAALNKEISKWTSESFSVEAVCYTTQDSVEKVVGFYKKVPGLSLMGESGEGAMFKKENVDITIQNPWMDAKTGQLLKSTLISIVKH
jgi:hypothetical protein